MGQLDVHIRHGSGGDDLAKIAVVGAGVLLLFGGGGAAAAVAGLAAAFVDLLYWVAGTIGCTAVAGAMLWAATRGRRAERRLRAAEGRAEMERAYRAEVEARRRERAAIQAEAQAQAWAPLITAIAAAVSQQQPQPQPVPVIRGEVER
jgi:hypothetical protein